MPRVILFLLFLLGFTRPGTGQLPNASVVLSPEASVSILTCAPGDELYSVFGHTAIRVTDPTQRIDLAFNFGTFDFNTPFFYFKFGQGTLDYILSVSSFRQFMQEYFITGRSVWEQTLTMNPEEKNRLFRALLTNALPQNRSYRYDFFYDNCATRVREMVLNALESPLVVRDQEPSGPLSFRQAIHPFLVLKPWTRLGLDLILGAPADEATDLWSLMFLPDHLMNGFGSLQLQPETGAGASLVSETNQLLEFNDPKPLPGGLSPALSLWLVAILILLLTLAQRYGVMPMRWLNPLLFLLAGVTGLLIGYLSFVSQHVATGDNWNFLWANPLWFFLVTNVNGFWKRLIAWGLLGMLLFLIVFSWSLPQEFPLELIPVWLILSMRLTLDLFRKRLG